jgi:hypothetical protein
VPYIASACNFGTGMKKKATLQFLNGIEEFEDTKFKGAIRIRKSKKGNQHNGKKGE